MFPPPAYSSSSPSAEHIEEPMSLTEKNRIATIAENKINSAFSLKREPSLRYILFQTALIVRATHEIYAHSTTAENQPKLEDEEDWESDSDEDEEDEERDWRTFDMKKQLPKETDSAKTSSNCNPFDDPPLSIDEETAPLRRSQSQFRLVHASSTSCRTLTECGDSKDLLSLRLAVIA